MRRRVIALASLTLTYLLPGCGDGSKVTGSGGLSSFERSAIEEIALERTPRARPELTYGGENPVDRVRFRPQPLRTWNVRMTEASEPVGVSTELAENFTLTSEEDAAVSIAVEGTLQVDLTAPLAVDADFGISGLDGCDRLQVAFRAVDEGESGGDIRCGDRAWAEFAFTPGRPLELVWSD